jgi:hypothetical protein
MSRSVRHAGRILWFALASACALASLRCRARSSPGAEPKVESKSSHAGVQASVPPSQPGRLPELVIGNNFGVNIHGASARDFDLIADAGFKFVRIDLTWQAVERSPGKYEWSRYDHMAEELAARKLRPLFILSYSNPIYAPEVEVKHGRRALRKPAAPKVRVALAAFSNWAAEAARHFARYDPVFEVWNEPDLDAFWPPRSSATEYVALANSACNAVRAASPDAIIIGPGAAKPPTRTLPRPEFLSAVLASELAGCLDAISVHPYLHISEMPHAGQHWQLLRALIAKEGRSRRAPLPLVSSETGLSTGGGSLLHRPPDESAQAFYAVRMLLQNFESGIPISIWYDWKDDGDDESEAENRFGLVRRDLSPKPAYVAVKTAFRELSGLRLACSRHYDNGQADLVFGGSGSKLKVASWSDAASGARLRLPAGAEAVVDMYGQALPHDATHAALERDAIGAVYVTLGEREATRFCAELRAEPQP